MTHPLVFQNPTWSKNMGNLSKQCWWELACLLTWKVMRRRGFNSPTKSKKSFDMHLWYLHCFHQYIFIAKGDIYTFKSIIKFLKLQLLTYMERFLTYGRFQFWDYNSIKNSKSQKLWYVPFKYWINKSTINNH